MCGNGRTALRPATSDIADTSDWKYAIRVKPAAHRSYCPRLSEASHVLRLIRGYLVGTASRPLATTVDLVPIVEDGLFGYELVPERDLHVYPIIGCNAQGEPALRVTSFDSRARSLHLVTPDGGVQFRSGRATRFAVQTSDHPFPNWLTAAESAWAHVRTPSAQLREQAPIRREKAHRSLDRALAVAHSHLGAWDPFIEFLGLPNEAQLGFALSDAGGGRGTLILQTPATWVLRWNSPEATINRSWPRTSPGTGIDADWPEAYRRFADRRAHRRRASDRGNSRDAWSGKDRREARGRRAIDRVEP